MPRRKPVAGVCGVCGTAQVQPQERAVHAKMQQDPDWESWVSGHLYEYDNEGHLNLRKVRCLIHAEEFDPRRQSRTWG
jgi:hypothetical protein